MTGITRRRSGELQRKVFEILLTEPEGLQAKDVLERVEKSIDLTDFERSVYPKRPGVRRFEKLVRFGSINMVKAGWLVKNKGVWRVTEEGERAYRTYVDPEAFFKEAVRLYREWKSNQPSEEIEEDEQDSPDALSTLEEAEETSWAEIETYLREMPPYEFQRLVATLLRAMGYFVSWDAPKGPDRGMDIIAHTDPLGTQLPRIKVQVKRRADKIDVEGMRSFMAVLGEHDVGIFISLGGFTSQAETEARTQEKRRLTLVDVGKLFDLWAEHYQQVPERDRRLLPLKPVYYLAPSE